MSLDIDKRILEKISCMEKEEGVIPLLLQFYRDLLRVQAEHQDHLEISGKISAELLQSRSAEGRSLLEFHDIDINNAALEKQFDQVVNVFHTYSVLFGDIPFDRLITSGEHFLTVEVIKAWFSGSDNLPAIGDGIESKLSGVMIQSAMRPVLRRYAENLISSVKQEEWRKRFCPVCGGIPDMAFLDKERGSRWLLCSRCDTEWLFQRLECAYCGTKDQSKLAFYSDEKELYRIQVCDQCKCYIKTIDLRKATDEILMPLERILTTSMDKQAREKGYHMPR